MEAVWSIFHARKNKRSQRTRSGVGEAGTGISKSGNPARSTVNSYNANEVLSGYGPPVFTCDVGPAANRDTGSFVNASFNGSQYFSGNGLAPVTSNFGFELWVKPTANGRGMIAYNGNSAANGWGSYFDSSGSEGYGNCYLLLGGKKLLSVGYVTVGSWTHLAVVYGDRSGVSGDIYNNGEIVDILFSADTPIAPDGTGCAIGAAPDSPSSRKRKRIRVRSSGQVGPAYSSRACNRSTRNGALCRLGAESKSLPRWRP